MHRLFAHVTATTTLFLSLSAQAATVSTSQLAIPSVFLSPTQTTVQVGESFNVDIVISGLNTAGVAGVSAFSMAVGWVPDLFSINGYTLGTTLGDSELGESNDISAGFVSANSFHVGQSSNLPVDILTTQLPDTFVLATLQFTALATSPACQCIVVSGSSGLPQAFDGNGDEFFFDVNVNGVEITVVPVPAAAWLLLGALAVLPRRRKPWKPGAGHNNIT
ncbi:MAG: hypothetical protein AB8G17_16965 [Gammaproteobacteria bacterium]